MKIFKQYFNDTFEEEKALVDITNDAFEIVMVGDFYHDKIDEMIDGFFCGLDYCGVEYSIKECESIDSDNELFELIGFNEC